MGSDTAIVYGTTDVGLAAHRSMMVKEVVETPEQLRALLVLRARLLAEKQVEILGQQVEILTQLEKALP